MVRRLIRAMTTAAIATLSVTAVGAAAQVDRTPPAAPYVIYASGLRWTGGCLPLTIGIQRSTESPLTYEVFADGVRLGRLTDTGAASAVWGTLHFTRPGSQTVTARAVDAAGNRSAASNANVVTAYAC